MIAFLADRRQTESRGTRVLSQPHVGRPVGRIHPSPAHRSHRPVAARGPLDGDAPQRPRASPSAPLAGRPDACCVVRLPRTICVLCVEVPRNLALVPFAPTHSDVFPATPSPFNPMNAGDVEGARPGDPSGCPSAGPAELHRRVPRGTPCRSRPPLSHRSHRPVAARGPLEGDAPQRPRASPSAPLPVARTHAALSASQRPSVSLYVPGHGERGRKRPCKGAFLTSEPCPLQPPETGPCLWAAELTPSQRSCLGAVGGQHDRAAWV